jgi:hypothetical protein
LGGSGSQHRGSPYWHPDLAGPVLSSGNAAIGVDTLRAHRPGTNIAFRDR